MHVEPSLSLQYTSNLIQARHAATAAAGLVLVVSVGVRRVRIAVAVAAFSGAFCLS